MVELIVVGLEQVEEFDDHMDVQAGLDRQFEGQLLATSSQLEGFDWKEQAAAGQVVLQKVELFVVNSQVLDHLERTQFVQIGSEVYLEKINARVHVDEALVRNYVHDWAVCHAHLSLIGMLVSLEFAEDVAVEYELAVDGVVVIRTDIEDQNLYSVLVL